MAVIHNNRVRQRYGIDSHGPSHITIWDVDVAAEAADVSATYLTVESEWPLSGEIICCEVNPYTTLAQNTAITIYESDNILTTYRVPVNITQAAANAEKIIYPVVQNTDNTGTATSGSYTRYPVHGYLTLKLSTNFIATDRVQVRLFVDTGGA